jgi:tetratricopeptide (TPR) repeat protein
MIAAPLPRFAVTDAQYQALLPTLRMLAGTSEVATLARALALTDGFALHLVGCETPHLAQALILWLASEVPKLQGAAIKMVRLEPTRSDMAERSSALDPMALGREVFDRLMKADAEPRVVFLDATDSQTDDRPAWIWLFQRLNERRNHLAQIGAPLVLLLPFDLEVELTRFASDLWSIRSAGLKLRKEPRVESPGLELPPLSLSSNEASSPRSGADVEALRAEVERWLHEPGPHAQRALVVAFQRLAEALHDRGETAQALQLLHEQVLPSIKSAPPNLLPALMFTTVETLVRLDQAEEAERIAREDALPALERSEDREWDTRLLSRLADAFRNQRQHEKALKILQDEALPNAELLADPETKAEVLSKIVLSQLALGHIEFARSLIDDAAFPLMDWLRPDVCAAMNLTLADQQRRQGDPGAAIQTLSTRVLPYCKGDMYPTIEVLAWVELGRAHRDRGELHEAISIWRQKAMPLYRRMGREASRVMVQGFVALALLELGDRESGLRLLRKDLETRASWSANTVRDMMDRRDTLLQISAVLAAYEESEEAKELLRDVLSSTTLWEEERSALRQRLAELEASEPAGMQARSFQLHTHAGPEVYAEAHQDSERSDEG